MMFEHVKVKDLEVFEFDIFYYCCFMSSVLLRGRTVIGCTCDNSFNIVL